MKSGLSLKKAADAMRNGSCLAKMYETCPPPELLRVAWFVIPGGRVDNNVARKLMERPDVHASQDGLFPGHSQTWKMAA